MNDERMVLAEFEQESHALVYCDARHMFGGHADYLCHYLGEK